MLAGRHGSTFCWTLSHFLHWNVHACRQRLTANNSRREHMSKQMSPWGYAILSSTLRFVYSQRDHGQQHGCSLLLEGVMVANRSRSERGFQSSSLAKTLRSCRSTSSESLPFRWLEDKVVNTGTIAFSPALFLQIPLSITTSSLY